jgi:hypothetical protein
MTVTDIARRGRDGESAVRSGLKELEKHGFLVRGRERADDGTLGAAAHFITDLPALHYSRSGPESGFPPVDDPTLADRPTRACRLDQVAERDCTSRPGRAGSGACSCKAEEGVDAMGVPPLERSREWGSRRPTTTRQMYAPDPATPG